MAKPSGVRLSGEARKQVMGDREARLGTPGDQGRARELPQPLLSAFTSAGGFPDSCPLASVYTEPELPGKSGLW